jgi:CheY-like chemotaxis protein
VVTNGQEALERLATGGISLVLTDCHMPVLDGFGLSNSVRADEQRSNGARARLPIVAVTANAVDGEGHRCLAAGMDAYLTKPVDVGRLVSVLGELLPPEPVPDPARIDLRMLREIVGADEGALVEILDSCMMLIEGEIADLRQALAAADGTRMSSAAHRIAGAASSVGARRLVSFARTIELAAAATGTNDTIGATVDWLDVELRSVRAELTGLGAGR